MIGGRRALRRGIDCPYALDYYFFVSMWSSVGSNGTQGCLMMWIRPLSVTWYLKWMELAVTEGWFTWSYQLNGSFAQASVISLDGDQNSSVDSVDLSWTLILHYKFNPHSDCFTCNFFEQNHPIHLLLLRFLVTSTFAVNSLFRVPIWIRL